VDINQSRGVEIEYRDKQLDKLQESIRCSLEIAIYVGHRFSLQNTNDVSRPGLEKFIKEAVAMTRFLSEDPFRSLPDAKYYSGRVQMDLNTVDPAFESLTTAQKIKLAQELEAAARSRSDKILSATCYYYDNHSHAIKIHSNGFEGHQEDTLYSLAGLVSVQDENSRPEDDDYAAVRHFQRLPSPETLGTSAALRALGKLGQKKLASAKMEMLIENRWVPRLIEELIRPLNGQALQQKSSYLENIKGKPMAAECFTLIDNPFIPEGLASRLFDRDGITAQKRVVVEKGVLKDFYIDPYYAKKLGVEPTTGWTSNMLIELGNRSLSEMIKSVKKGILITRFIGGNANPTTGDFSLGVMGRYVENGTFIHPINEMNISGNFEDLWKRLVEVGSDIHPFGYKGWRFPTLRFQDVQFSGK
jgi:PmbA protein